jgi:hypothetical protein
LIIAITCTLFLAACDLFKFNKEASPPDLSGYWLAPDVLIEDGESSYTVRALTRFQSGSIEFLVFTEGGDQLAGMRGTYTNTIDTLSISVASTYDSDESEWVSAPSQKDMLLSVNGATCSLVMDGDNDETLTVNFMKIDTPDQPAAWVGEWEGTWGEQSGTADIILGEDGSFDFAFDGTEFDLAQSGTWGVVTTSTATFIFTHITQQTINTVTGSADFYGLCEAVLEDDDSATVTTSMGDLVLEKLP